MASVLEPCTVCGRLGALEDGRENPENPLVAYGDAVGWILVCVPCRQEKEDACEERFIQAWDEDRLIVPADFTRPADWERDYELGVGD